MARINSAFNICGITALPSREGVRDIMMTVAFMAAWPSSVMVGSYRYVELLEY